MSGATLLADRYPSVVEALFEGREQAERAKQALALLDLGALPAGFQRFTLIERRPAPQITEPSGWLGRLGLRRGGREPTPSSRALPQEEPTIILLARGEADRLQTAVKLLQEHGARRVRLYTHGRGG